MLLRALGALAALLAATNEAMATTTAPSSPPRSRKSRPDTYPAPASLSRSEPLPKCHCVYNVVCNVTCNMSERAALPPTPPAAPCPPCTARPCAAPAGPTAPPQVPANIPSGYVVQPKQIYKFYGCDQAKSRKAASEECTKDKGHLVFPRTKSEIYLLVGAMIFHPDKKPHYCKLHVGIEKDGHNKFKAILGQELNSFVQDLLAAGQMDGTEEDEQCITLHRDGRMGDEDCDEPQAFVCQLGTDEISRSRD